MKRQPRIKIGDHIENAKTGNSGIVVEVGGKMPGKAGRKMSSVTYRENETGELVEVQEVYATPTPSASEVWGELTQEFQKTWTAADWRHRNTTPASCVEITPTKFVRSR